MSEEQRSAMTTNWAKTIEWMKKEDLVYEPRIYTRDTVTGGLMRKSEKGR